MSQEKTIIPGMNITNNPPVSEKPAETPKTKVAPTPEAALQNEADGDTKIELPTPQSPVAPLSPQPTAMEVGRPAIYLQDRPIVGILVSASNEGKMEMFPLYLGRNVIGRQPKADVMLNEETVSGEQAVIVVRHIAQPVDRYITTLTDTNSTCGTYVNGQPTDFDTHILEDRDVIRFGMGYEMMYLRLNAEELGLKACPSFKPAAETDAGPRQRPAVAASRDDDEPRTVLYR